jgi:hypothetical protein
VREKIRPSIELTVPDMLSLERERDGLWRSTRLFFEYAVQARRAHRRRTAVPAMPAHM